MDKNNLGSFSKKHRGIGEPTRQDGPETPCVGRITAGHGSALAFESFFGRVQDLSCQSGCEKFLDKALQWGWDGWASAACGSWWLFQRSSTERDPGGVEQKWKPGTTGVRKRGQDPGRLPRPGQAVSTGLKPNLSPHQWSNDICLHEVYIWCWAPVFFLQRRDWASHAAIYSTLPDPNLLRCSRFAALLGICSLSNPCLSFTSRHLILHVTVQDHLDFDSARL